MKKLRVVRIVVGTAVGAVLITGIARTVFRRMRSSGGPEIDHPSRKPFLMAVPDLEPGGGELSAEKPGSPDRSWKIPEAGGGAG